MLIRPNNITILLLRFVHLNLHVDLLIILQFLFWPLQLIVECSSMFMFDLNYIEEVSNFQCWC